MYLSRHLIGHLPFLAAVARCQSFTVAAESLHVSQAAVSYQIRQLERKLGLLLVVRQSGSRIYLTSAGQTLVNEYLECEKRLQLTLENLGSDDPKGTLNMTVPVDFGSAVMPAVMVRLAQSAPQLQVNLHVSDDVVDMVSNQIDLAIRTNAQIHGMKYALLARSRKHLVASRGYLKQFGTPCNIEELAEHRLLVRGTQSTFSWQQLLGQAGLSLEDMPQKTNLGNTFAMAEGVRQGLGMAILPRFILVSELRRGSVIPLLEQYSTPLVTDFYLIHLPAPQMGRFADLITVALNEVLRDRRYDGCFDEITTE